MGGEGFRVTDYRLDISVRNNRILCRIHELGYENVSRFCKENGFTPTSIGLLVNLRESPLNNEGEWRPLAKRLADALYSEPDDLWTMEQRFMHLPTNRRFVEVSESEALSLISDKPSPEMITDQSKVYEFIDGALEGLTPRERDVIERRFGLGNHDEHTLEQLGKLYGVHRVRIQQIESKALRKLRYGGPANRLARLANPDSELCKVCGDLLKLDEHNDEYKNGVLRPNLCLQCNAIARDKEAKELRKVAHERRKKLATHFLKHGTLENFG